MIFHSRRIGSFLDFFAFRILLVLLGLAVSECTLRVVGIRPWPDLPPDLGREYLTSSDAKIGWVLNPHDHHRAFTGSSSHTETVGPDRLRLVLPTNHGSEQDAILILGDSTMFGWGLDDDKTFPSLLARRVPYPILNAAVPGYGALQSYLWMTDLLKTQRPARVILGYADFMLDRDIADRNWVSPAAAVNNHPNIQLPVADLIDGRLSISEASPIFPELPGRQTFAIIRLVEEISILPGTLRRRKQKEEIAKAIFSRWATDVRAIGSQGYVLFWKDDGSFERFGQHLSAIEVKPIRCIHPEFGTPKTIIAGDGHPTAFMTEYWAQCVAEHLAKE